MIEEQRYDAAFVRDWTNGPFLVAEDGTMLRARDIVADGGEALRVAWDAEAAKPVLYDPASGAYDGASSALAADRAPRDRGRGRHAPGFRRTSCAPPPT